MHEDLNGVLCPDANPLRDANCEIGPDFAAHIFGLIYVETLEVTDSDEALEVTLATFGL